MIVFLEFNGMQESTERGETNSNALVQSIAYRLCSDQMWLTIRSSDTLHKI